MSTDGKTQMIADGKIEYIYKDLTYKIIGCLYDVHKELGAVHKEIIYHKALTLELKDKNISFIEEKAIDVTYKGKKIGSIADMAIVTFHPVKHITTGEGGMVITNSKKFYDKLKFFRNHGIIKKT